MFKHYSAQEIACALAILLLPWQARWIYSYQLLNGQPYEYGTLSVYASSLILIIAVALTMRAQQWRIRLGRSAWILVAWLLFVVMVQIDIAVGFHTLSIAILGFGYFLLARYTKPRVVLASIMISGVVQALVAWYYFIAQYIPASTILGVAEHTATALGQSVVMINDTRILRAYGLMPHPNILGGFLVIAFAYAVHAYIQQTKERNARYRWRTWVLQLYASIFIFSGILITFSRAALVSAALLLVGWGVYAFLVDEKMLVRSVGRIGVSVLALFLVFNLLAGGIWMQRFGVVLGSEQNTEQVRLEQISADERIASFHQAAVLLQPGTLVKGVGLGGFVPTLARAFPDLDVYRYQPTHNAFMLMVLEVGVIGAGLYLWFIVRLMTDTWRDRKRSIDWQYLFSIIGIIAFMGFFDHFLWTQYVGQSLWWLVVGIAAYRR